MLSQVVKRAATCHPPRVTPACFLMCCSAPPAGSQTRTVGPMASRRQRQIVHRHVSSAVAEGARLVLGGKMPDDDEPGNFYPPTVRDGALALRPQIHLPTSEPIVYTLLSLLSYFTILYTYVTYHILYIRRCCSTCPPGLRSHPRRLRSYFTILCTQVLLDVPAEAEIASEEITILLYYLVYSGAARRARRG